MRFRFTLLCFFLLLTGQSLVAQLTLNVTNVDTSAFPSIKLHVVTKEGILLRRDLDSSNYSVREDGIPQSGVRLNCEMGNRPFGIAALIATGSMMTQSDVNAAKGVAEKFFNALDGVNDEGALAVYSSTPSVAVSMTPVRAQLLGALGGISASTGGNKFWDGVFAAIQEAASSVNVRAVMVLSNGRDDGSGKTLTDVVNLATTTNVRVYTLGINASGGESNLQNLAQQTGGMYFTNSDLAFQTVINTLRQTPDHCVLEYLSSNGCKDGVARTISVRVRIGNDSVATNQSVTLGPDPSTNVNSVFKVDSLSITSGKLVSLPINLLTSVTNQLLQPATIDVEFDKTKLTLTAVRTDSTIAESNTATFSATANGARIQLGGVSALNSSGKILRLIFSAGDVSQNTPVQVALTSWTFTRGCLIPTLQSGAVLITPKKAVISGTGTPVIFTWNEPSKDYSPSPGALRIEITNTGELPVTGLSATLPQNGNFKLAYGSTPAMSVAPSTLQPGQKGTVTWYIRAIPRATEATEQIDVVTTSNENAQTSTRVFVNIKAAVSAVAVELQADAITIQGGAHTPNPATVRATVKSAGTATGPSGQVKLVLEPGLTRSSGDEIQSFSAMASGASETPTWEFTYPTTDTTDKVYLARVVTSVTGAREDTNTIAIRVPGLRGASLSASCLTLDGLQTQGVWWIVPYDSVSRQYPIIVVRAVVRNTGSAPSGEVKAVLMPGVELNLEAGQTAEKIVSASLAPSDSATVSWRLRSPSAGCVMRETGVTFTVEESGKPFHSCNAAIRLEAGPNLLPELRSRTPKQVDTLSNTRMHRFAVDVSDPDEDEITYRWVLNGVTVGIDSSAMTRNYPDTGMQVLQCIIKDRCGMDSVIVEWRFVITILTSVAALPAANDFSILGNYPNPFNPSTTISCIIPDGRHHVTLSIVDQFGCEVEQLAGGVFDGGSYRFTFEGGRLSAGVYYALLRSGNVQRIRPIVLLK